MLGLISFQFSHAFIFNQREEKRNSTKTQLGSIKQNIAGY